MGKTVRRTSDRSGGWGRADRELQTHSAVHRRASNRDARCGAALVEMALVTPLLLAVLFGIVEFGRAMQVHAMVTNASREGARRGSVTGYSSDDVRRYVREHLSTALGIPAETVAVNVTVEPAAGHPAVTDTLLARSKDLVIVKVAVPFDRVCWTSGSYLTGKSLTARSVMRHE